MSNRINPREKSWGHKIAVVLALAGTTYLVLRIAIPLVTR